MAVSFTQSAFDSLYWNTTGAPSVGYLLPPGATAEATISLADSWSKYSGCYLFVDTAVPSDAATQQTFAHAMRTILADPGLTGTRFVWLGDPLDPAYPVVLTLLVLDGEDEKTVTRLARFPLRNLAVAAAPGCRVELASSGTGFTLTPTYGASPNGVYLTTAYDAALLNVVHGDVTIPIGGERSGCLCFAVQLDTTDGKDDLDHLDVGLRIFVRTPFEFEDSNGQAEDGQPFFLDSLRYPIFADPRLSLEAVLDPIRPLGHSRSWFSVTKTGSGRSHYRSTMGYPVTLNPGSDARLVFAPRPGDSTVSPESPLYLVPSGEFVLGVDPKPRSGEADMMCGYSGVEYVKLHTDGTDRVRFVPDRPAFTAAFTAKPPGARTTVSSDQLLTDLATTSWAYVLRTTLHGDADQTQAESVVYCAQPDSSVLYEPGEQAKAAITESTQAIPLSYMEIASAHLPSDNTSTFPMLPYAGIATERSADYAGLEETAIGPCRRNEIAALTAGSEHHIAPDFADSESTVDVVSTTPQGLRVTIRPDQSMLTTVTVAVNADDTGKYKGPVNFINIPRGSNLWTALASNQLFLVATDPDSLRDHVAGDARLVADGWPFLLHPDTWRPLESEHPTIFIMKYCERSLRDMAGYPDAWCSPDAFNVDSLKAFEVLQKIIADAISPPKGRISPDDPDLAHFVNTVLLDPKWNGMVVLNAATDMNGWPEQLRGLAAGIDPNRLVGHHVGVYATPTRTVVNNSTKTLEIVSQPSSIFGLIDYDDPQLLPASRVPYDFKILSLRVRIHNSKVANFSSKITFQINRLFNEQCTLDDGINNNLILDGMYETNNGIGSYVFRTPKDKNSGFMLDSAVIRSMEISRAQFVTVTENAPVIENTLGGSAPPPIQTRLLLWGVIDFAALPKFDAFSFGSSGDAIGKVGLAVADAAIAMTVYPSTDPKRQASKTLRFDASRMTFDPVRSTARKGSLYEAFPLQLDSFVQVDSATAPTELGYASVTTPLAPGLLNAPWFGLCFRLELGSLGAWAEGGRLDARLLLAWGPRGDEGLDETEQVDGAMVLADSTPNMFIGLSLPGLSGSKKEFDLQGPLKLKIKNIAIEVTLDGGYVLWFQSLTLGIFRLTFPPTGRTDLLLFPGESGGKKALGWYAAYDKSASGGS